MNTLTISEKFALADQLLACPKMSTHADRQVVISQLPESIKNAVLQSGRTSAKNEVLAIIDACLVVERGLVELIVIVGWLEGSSAAFRELCALLTSFGVNLQIKSGVGAANEIDLPGFLAQLQKQQQEKDEEIKLLRSQLQDKKETAEREQEVAAARLEMEKATSREEQLAAYRRALMADQNLALIHVLDMTRPLSLNEMYIKLRLHQHRKSYKLETALVEAESKADPNAHIVASRLVLTDKTAKAYEPGEAVRQNKHIVVLGDPGAGKTTMLKYLALRSVRGELANLPAFPIHVILGRLAADLKKHKAKDSNKEVSLAEWVAGYWQERYNFPQKAALTLIEEQLQAGEALLLLDGLDETTSGASDQEAKESYDRITNLIQNFTNHYPKVRVVITVRFAGFLGNLPGFTEFEVLDFTQKDIEQFVKNWYSYDPGQAKELAAQLKRNPRVETLAANPLLLTLIAMVFEGYQGLPKTRTELYEKCVETLLEKWDSSRRIKRVGTLGIKQKKRLLVEVGWHFHKCRQRYLPKKVLLSVIGSVLVDMDMDNSQNEQLLQEIAAEHGLLKEQATGWYGFLHLTLQEYFAGLYASVNSEVITFLVAQRDNPWWHEVILLYAGEVQDVSPFLEQLWNVVETGQDDIFHTSLLLAGECLATHSKLHNRRLKTQIVERLMQLITDEAEHHLNRERGVERLAIVGGEEILSRLLRLLADDELDSSVRGSVAEAFGKLGEPSVLPQLLALLMDKTLSGYIKNKITVEAIGRLAHPSILPQLLTLLADDKLDRFARGNIAEVVGKLRESSTLPQLLTLLADDKLNRFLGITIVEAIGRLAYPSVLPQLLALLADEKLDSSVRDSIAGAIGRLGDPSVLPQLLTLLADNKLDSSVRDSIAGAIMRLVKPSVLPQLLALLADEKLDSCARSNIANVIGRLGDPSVLPQLLGLLADEKLDSSVQGSIARAIGRLGDPSVLPQLLGLLADEKLDKHMRSEMVVISRRLGGPSVLPQLLALLADERLDSFVRITITEAIERQAEPSVLPQLLTLLADERLDSSVRRNIVLVIGSLDAPQLLTLLADERLDSSVRNSIAKAIGRFGDPSVLPQLFVLLADEKLDNFVRNGIAETIGRLGNPSVLPQLLTLLADERLANSVRSALAEVIGKLGESSVLPQLLVLLADKWLDSRVRKYIAEAAVDLTQTLENLEQVSALLKRWDAFAQLYQASQRIGVSLHWLDKSKGTIMLEQESLTRFSKVIGKPVIYLTKEEEGNNRKPLRF